MQAGSGGAELPGTRCLQPWGAMHCGVPAGTQGPGSGAPIEKSAPSVHLSADMMPEREKGLFRCFYASVTLWCVVCPS